LPLMDSLVARLGELITTPYPPCARSVFRPEGGVVCDVSLPLLAGGFTISAQVEMPSGPAQGVLCALGDWTGGFALYAIDDALHFTLNRAGDIATVSSSALATGAGAHALACTYGFDDPAAPVLRLLCDD